MRIAAHILIAGTVMSSLGCGDLRDDSARSETKTTSGSNVTIRPVVIPLAPLLVVEEGDGQWDRVGEPLPLPLQVRLFDQFGDVPLADEVIQYFIRSGDARFSNTSRVVTDENGRASVSLILGEEVEPLTVEARWDAGGDPTQDPIALFYVDVSVGAPHSVMVLEGEGQCVGEGGAFPAPIRARLEDRFGNILSYEAVKVTAINGIVNYFSPQVQTYTDWNGEVSFVVSPDVLSSQNYDAEVILRIEPEAAPSAGATVHLRATHAVFLDRDPALGTGEFQATSWQNDEPYDFNLRALGVCDAPLAKQQIECAAVRWDGAVIADRPLPTTADGWTNSRMNLSVDLGASDPAWVVTCRNLTTAMNDVTWKIRTP